MYIIALTHDKSDYKTVMNLAQSYRHLNLLDDALKYANKAVGMKPMFSKPYAVAALIMQQMGKISMAVSTMEIAIRNQHGNLQTNEQYIELKQCWKQSMCNVGSETKDA